MSRRTDALIELIRAASERGATAKEIAVVSGYTDAYIYQLRSKNGITPQGRIWRVPDQRVAEITERLKAGETLEAISLSYGITRERVRQIAKPQRESVRAARLAAKIEQRKKLIEARNQQRDAKALRFYGCTHAEAIALNNGLPLSAHAGRALQYRYWANNVVRSIKSTFELTFPQWCAVWGDKWEQRGRGHGYYLSRIDRLKPFTIDNVRVERGHEVMARHRKTRPWLNANHATAEASA